LVLAQRSAHRNSIRSGVQSLDRETVSAIGDLYAIPVNIFRFRSPRGSFRDLAIFLSSARRKVPYRRPTRRLQPATDIYLGVRLSAVMPTTIGGRCFRAPLNHGQFSAATSNDEPVDRIGGHRATNLTSEFCNRRHRDDIPSDLIRPRLFCSPKANHRPDVDASRQSGATSLRRARTTRSF